MSCACKHEQENIQRDAETLDAFRAYFIRRMTEDGSDDARRKDYNQPIFGWWEEDRSEADPEKTFQWWTQISMDMVLRCFDDAMRDFKKRYCDECKRSKFEMGEEES